MSGQQEWDPKANGGWGAWVTKSSAYSSGETGWSLEDATLDDDDNGLVIFLRKCGLTIEEYLAYPLLAESLDSVRNFFISPHEWENENAFWAAKNKRVDNIMGRKPKTR